MIKTLQVNANSEVWRRGASIYIFPLFEKFHSGKIKIFENDKFLFFFQKKA